jgi:hypothetical protein
MRQSSRAWRSVLVALISFALVLSFFHGWSFDGDSGALSVAAVQASCDASGKAPADSAVPHGDHCLAHLTTGAPQDNAETVEYVTHLHRFVAMLTPDSADLASPFKPPRA